MDVEIDIFTPRVGLDRLIEITRHKEIDPSYKDLPWLMKIFDPDPLAPGGATARHFLPSPCQACKHIAFLLHRGLQLFVDLDKTREEERRHFESVVKLELRRLS